MVYHKIKTLIFTISIITLARANTKPDYRHIFYNDLQSSVQRFPLEGVTSYSQILFDVSRNQVFVGGRDALYRLHLSQLQLLEEARWESDKNKVQACLNKGQGEENCHNYIKILLTNGNQIFTCGTNAFSPICTWRNVDDLSNITRIVDGIAKCPYNPAASVTGFVSDTYEYFFGGTTDFSSSDSLISKVINGEPTLRTKQYNSFWLNDPQFVGSFETSKFAYFLFKETAVEYINCGKVVYSRIARVCKNDKGGNTMLKDNWTTFIKARLNCSVSGDYPFYYNEIQSAQFIPEEDVIYATFTTPNNSIAGSAVCAFNMTSINEAFDGPFKYQPDMNSAWIQHDISNRDHLNCKSKSYSPLDVSKYQLMDNAVQATSLNPIHSADLERFTHLTVDVVKTKHDYSVHVIYVATEDGTIKKLSILPKATSACLVEVWHTSSDFESTITNIQFLKETNSIYATTDKGLIRIPADHCQRHFSRENCIHAMDPYCGWNEIEDKCTTAPNGDPHHRFWKQKMNGCPILDTPIHGGWSSWSSWEPCYHRTSPDSENDHCQCQTRICNNPAPSNNGKPCQGPFVAVANCTVHGGWSDWSAWSACSATCGVSVKTRYRTCTNPAPAFGGRVCVGQDRKEAFCYELPPCPIQPIDGGWSAWSEWSTCPKHCGSGFRTRKRKCDNPPPKHGGQHCFGNDVEYQACPDCPKEHEQHLYTEWLTDYNISRHVYHQKRFKITCKSPAKHARQITMSVEHEDQTCQSSKCEPESDKNWSSWTNWSECSVSCGRGTQSRTRYCLKKSSCSGTTTETRDCNKRPCDDSWGCWSEWSPCNVSCGWGVKTRYRTCLGQKCRGADKEEEACQDQPCENILGWGNWTVWSLCDQNNEQHRKRTCYTENPGTHMCQGSSVETRMCVGNTFNNEIRAYGVQEEYDSCSFSNVILLFVGIFIGLVPLFILVAFNRFKKKQLQVPSSPHYIPAESNPYIALPVRDKAHQLKKQHSYNGSGTIKSKFDFDFSTLKRHSNELKNGNEKHYDSDKYLYE